MNVDMPLNKEVKPERYVKSNLNEPRLDDGKSVVEYFIRLIV